MMQSEFEALVGMKVSPSEYYHIEQVYMNSDLDKVEFSKLWVKMNKSRVECALANEKARKEKEALDDKLWGIISRYAGWDYMKKETVIAADVFGVREINTMKKAGIDLLDGFRPINVATALWEIRKYLKAV